MNKVATVHEWLRSLKDEHRELFVEKCQNCASITELQLYAKFLIPAWEGSIADLYIWFKEFYYEKDLKHLLIAEAEKIEHDIKKLRSLIYDLDKNKTKNEEEFEDPDLAEISVKAITEVSGKVAALQQQLRGHVTSVLQIKAAQDSKLLKLEGAEMVVSGLMEAFSDSPETAYIIEQTGISVYDDIINAK